jgi:hypothetical protein
MRDEIRSYSESSGIRDAATNRCPFNGVRAARSEGGIDAHLQEVRPSAFQQEKLISLLPCQLNK